MTTLGLAAGHWILAVVIWGIWQLRPGNHANRSTLANALDGLKGLRYIMACATGLMLADALYALASHKPLTLTDVAGLFCLALGGVAVMLAATRIDDARPGKD